MLDTIEERSEEARLIPQQMCQNHLGHYQQAAAEPVDNIIRDKANPETATVKVMKCRLEWLGHVARIPDNCTPKICLFSWLPQPCLRGGPRLRWRDMIRKDLRVIKVSEDKWYDEASMSKLTW